MLKDVDVASLPRLPFSQLKELPEKGAIYFVLSSEGEVLYIGKANNLLRRWRTHHRTKQLGTYESVSIAWLEVEDKKLLRSLEAKAIETLQPFLNGCKIPELFRVSDYHDIRSLMREYLEVSGTSQKELADAAHKHPMQVNKALRGEEGKLPTVWVTMLQAAGMKLVMIPEDSDVNPLELVRQKAIAVRGSKKRLKVIPKAMKGK